MADLHQYNNAFRAFLDTLNAVQRKAVEQVEGPVLVLAGPGTGKTHLLTARIGNILLNTDARAQNVLCLTFTDAGANAMRQRLLQRIGPEAHRVPIYTFHAFCNRVIQDNTEYFGRGHVEPVTDLERIDIIRQMLQKLSPEHPLRAGRKDPYEYEEHLRDLFASIKKEGWTAGYVISKADAFIKGLPTNPDYLYQRNTRDAKKGDPKKARMQEITDKLERLKSAADLYPKYLHAMQRSNRYEYEDMLLWVIRAFEKNEALLRSYQERYQYVLVDEFQDTNGAQYRLLQQLLNFWDKPNIFIVGDDDQSIYEFQGARLENLLHFHRQHQPHLLTVMLEENYRSPQPLLDVASRLIAHNGLRAVSRFEQPLEKSLRAAAAAAPHSQPVLHLYPTRLHETADTVHQISQLLQQGTSPDQIAVLYARHRQADRLLHLLEKKGIHYQTKRPVNTLDLPLMGQLRDLLRYLLEESRQPYSGEHRLFRLLHAAFFRLSPRDLAQMAIALQASRQPTRSDAATYDKASRQRSAAVHWRTVLHDAAWLSSLQVSDPQRILDLAQRLDQWIADVHNLHIAQLLERLMAQTGVLQWALDQPDRVWHLQVLHSIHEFVQRESARHPRLSLEQLLALLDGMDDNHLALSVQQPVHSGPAVQLLTAHAAKGLEFEHVFLLDCTEEAWGNSTGNARGRFTLPPTLTLSGEEDALEARRRLFYVAMTRARHHLTLSCARADEAGKPLRQVQFVDEINLPAQAVEVPQAVLLDTQALLLAEAARPVITLPEASLLDALLHDFRLSVTSFNRYLRCPVAFYYEDLLHVPAATSEASAFGIAMHTALQHFVLRMKADKKQQWPAVESLVRLYGQEMERQRGHFSEHTYSQYWAVGKEHLRRLHAEQVPYWRKRAIVERRVDRSEVQGVPITGVLDKIEWLDGGQLRVVDYKTGTPNLRKVAPPDDKQPQGGSYWRQLVFYKILLDNARLYPEQVSKAAICWLEPDRRGTYPIHEISISPDEVRVVEALIRQVWDSIQQRAFTEGCGQEDCVWCMMLRHHTLTHTEVHTEEAGLDD